VGNEVTFEHDVDDPEVIHAQLLALSDQVPGRLRAAGTSGRTVSLKVRFADFSTIAGHGPCPRSTDVGKDVYDTVPRAVRRRSGLQRVAHPAGRGADGGLADAERLPINCCWGRRTTADARRRWPSTHCAPGHGSESRSRPGAER